MDRVLRFFFGGGSKCSLWLKPPVSPSSWVEGNKQGWALSSWGLSPVCLWQGQVDIQAGPAEVLGLWEGQRGVWGIQMGFVYDGQSLSDGSIVIITLMVIMISCRGQSWWADPGLGASSACSFSCSRWEEGVHPLIAAVIS